MWWKNYALQAQSQTGIGKRSPYDSKTESLLTSFTREQWWFPLEESFGSDSDAVATISPLLEVIAAAARPSSRHGVNQYK